MNPLWPSSPGSSALRGALHPAEVLRWKVSPRMSLPRPLVAAAAGAALAAAFPAPGPPGPALLHAQEAPGAASAELAAFGGLVVGTWEDEAGSRHRFEWSVGRQAIRSRSYAPGEDGAELVSEGFWFRDPEDGVIRGRVVAVGMDIDLFEYTSRVEDGEIVHDLVTHGALAGRFVERWIFDGDSYRWSLEQDGQPLMGGVYRRVEPTP